MTAILRGPLGACTAPVTEFLGGLPVTSRCGSCVGCVDWIHREADLLNAPTDPEKPAASAAPHTKSCRCADCWPATGDEAFEKWWDSVTGTAEVCPIRVAREIYNAGAEAADASLHDQLRLQRATIEALRAECERLKKVSKWPETIEEVAAFFADNAELRIKLAAAEAERDGLLEALAETTMLIRSQLAHVSHGGPTRADGERVVAAAEKALEWK